MKRFVIKYQIQDGENRYDAHHIISGNNIDTATDSYFRRRYDAKKVDSGRYETFSRNFEMIITIPITKEQEAVLCDLTLLY